MNKKSLLPYISNKWPIIFNITTAGWFIIDTNFKNNTLTGMSVQPFESQNSITENGAQLNPNATRLSIDINLSNATVVGNKGGYNSPSELLAGVDFKKKIRELGKQYDYIFLEAACLGKYSDARELVDYVDKIIPVFDASTSLNQSEEEALTFYKSQGDKMMGSILNKVECAAQTAIGKR